EGEDARVAEQEIERHGSEAEDDDAAGKFRVAMDVLHPIGHRQQHDPDDDVRRVPAKIGSGHQKRPSSPSNPPRRPSRTSPMITYMTASLADGKKTVVMPEATPINRPPNRVPGRLARPPTMMATKLGMIRDVPIVGCSPSWPAARTPARPAR